MKTIEEIIGAKRDGREHPSEDIDRLIAGFVAGEVPDYQMSAWMMAVVLRGLSDRETVDLSRAMVDSGETVDLSGIPGLKADKHSTGGVGDTTTLVLVPLVAAVGVPVAKMSGRGLGHTGGTIDKLESIPGFGAEMEIDAFVAQVAHVGCAVISSRADIDPADKKMYALRDVTATVPSVPLIVGSIVSKKVAGGADAIVIDVKVGSGAFMKDEIAARELARSLAATGAALGRRVSCVLTDMDQPLGLAVGNALEVREAVETLRGDGPEDLRELCLELGGKMVVLAEGAKDESAARRLLERAIGDGSALAKFERWIEAQGGDPRVAGDPASVLPSATLVATAIADRCGYVAAFDTEEIGRAAMRMGAGRASKEDVIDPAAGIVLAVKAGEWVEAGQPLATLHAAREDLIREGRMRVLDAIRIADEPVTPAPLFGEV